MQYQYANKCYAEHEVTRTQHSQARGRNVSGSTATIELRVGRKGKDSAREIRVKEEAIANEGNGGEREKGKGGRPPGQSPSAQRGHGRRQRRRTHTWAVSMFVTLPS